MSISPSLIYFWQLADDLRAAFGFLGFGSTVVSIAYLLYAFVFYDERRHESSEEFNARRDRSVRERTPVFFRILAVNIATALLSFLIPKSSTVAMMVVIPEIAKSKVIQADLPDLYNAAVDALKTALKK